MLLVDAHEDLAYNILSFGRDYTRSAVETRRLEQSAPCPDGDTLLGWPEYQRGQVAIVFATLFATPLRKKLGAWETQVYATSEEARRIYSTQLDIYKRLSDKDPGKFRLLGSRADLDLLLSHWADSSPDQPGHPVGLVPLMEGAEAIQSPGEVAEWWERGLRIIGPAWAGTRFCGGTTEPGPLTSEGRALLAAMSNYNLTLDLSHMDETAALESLDEYPGPIIASHANMAALLTGTETNRHFTDRALAGLIERDGVIGVVGYNAFIKAGWKKGDNRQEVSLSDLVPHIDHICQMAGDARHAGLGTDFDGGFGLESTPHDVDTIADMQNLQILLAGRGYSPADIEAILAGNWLSHLKRSLPAV
jgi:membrane dipeptidase